jgi:hypothetical protein
VSDRILSVLILILAGFGWASTMILVNAARKRPRIGILTERAAIGVFLSLFVSIYALAALNSDTGFSWLDSQTVKTVVRVLVVILCFIPVYWVFLYLTDRLGPRE